MIIKVGEDKLGLLVNMYLTHFYGSYQWVNEKKGKGSSNTPTGIYGDDPLYSFKRSDGNSIMVLANDILFINEEFFLGFKRKLSVKDRGLLYDEIQKWVESKLKLKKPINRVFSTMTL
jgi:hypothetical protein